MGSKVAAPTKLCKFKLVFSFIEAIVMNKRHCSNEGENQGTAIWAKEDDLSTAPSSCIVFMVALI
jgi:hypothetical protein